jgi:hypothetical protein
MPTLTTDTGCFENWSNLVEEDLVSDAVSEMFHSVLEVRRRQVWQSRRRTLDARKVDPLKAQADQAFRITHMPGKAQNLLK